MRVSQQSFPEIGRLAAVLGAGVYTGASAPPGRNVGHVRDDKRPRDHRAPLDKEFLNGLISINIAPRWGAGRPNRLTSINIAPRWGAGRPNRLTSINIVPRWGAGRPNL